MAIQRSDPLRELQRLQENMNRLFEEVLTRSSGSASTDPAGTAAWKPLTDLVEQTDRYVVRADLPGVVAAEVEVLVERGRLVLRGERRREGPTPDEAYLRVERPDGRFLVQIALPTSVDQQRIEATHSNGVLEVLLPKRQDESPGRIEVAPRG